MVSVIDEPDVRVVRLDRPDQRNALRPRDLDVLRDSVREAEQPVVYLSGAGPAFCAGADLGVVNELDEDAARDFAQQGQRTMNAIEDAETVVVAGIDGAARGGGVELALACDVRIATPAATFAETGVTIGLFGAWGGTRRLPRTVGAADAADVSLSGRVVDAEAAHRMGLVSRVVGDPRRVADEIAANDPAALCELKRLLTNRSKTRQQQDDREAAAFADLIENRK